MSEFKNDSVFRPVHNTLTIMQKVCGKVQKKWLHYGTLGIIWYIVKLWHSHLQRAAWFQCIVFFVQLCDAMLRLFSSNTKKNVTQMKSNMRIIFWRNANHCIIWKKSNCTIINLINSRNWTWTSSALQRSLCNLCWFWLRT